MAIDRPLDQAPPAPVVTQRRLDAIDGLRAFAALWVVLFHMRAFSGAHLGGVPGLDLFVRSGSTGVSLFLVLSGFCLFVPFAGGRLHRFTTGPFMVRRARRLLPAYYATLAVLVVAYLVANGRLGLARFSLLGMGGQVFTHLTLTHPLTSSTFYGLNGAYWSLGLEWELYLTLPLLIIAARRIGLARTVAAVIAVNIVYRLGLELAIHHGTVAASSPMATAVLPNLFLGRWGEFALGMVAAELYVTDRAAHWAGRLRYVALALIPLGFAVSGNPLAHLVFGVVFMTLVCTVVDHDHVVARVFAWRPLVVLGLMSYSIYLVHQPLVEVGAHLLGDAGGSPLAIFVELVALLPALLLVAWVLFVTVERRTMSVPDDVPGRSLLFPRWRLRRAVA
jgi:peptidoglycan/LPS O-acetylase OafA/YrhL